MHQTGKSAEVDEHVKRIRDLSSRLRSDEVAGESPRWFEATMLM